MIDCNDLLDTRTTSFPPPCHRVVAEPHPRAPTRLALRINGFLVSDCFNRPVAFDLYEARVYLRRLGLAAFQIRT